MRDRHTAAAGTLPAPFDERAMHAVHRALPIGAAAFVHVPHIEPRVTAAGTLQRSPQNTADNDSGGQSGYIIDAGTAAGDGSIYVAMTAYDDAWVTTPTDGYYNTVNAPTTHGPNGNCIETVTNYNNGFGTPGTTVDQVQFYDFCADSGQGAFVGAIPMDADFVRDYVRTYADSTHPLPRYISAVIHSSTDNRWHAYLYNASLMQYVDYYDSAAGANTQELGAEGWSIFETHYYGGVCATLPDVSEEGLQVRTSSGWQLLNPAEVYSYVSGTCFDAPLTAPYYVPQFTTSPDVAWTVTSQVAPASSEYARVIRNDAPAAYYRLGDSTSSAVDSSGNAHTGTYGTAVTRTAPSLLAVESDNLAAQFPGGASIAANEIAVPASTQLQPAGAVSVESWVDLSRAAAATSDLVSYGPESAGQAYTVQLLANDTIGAYITTSTGYGFVSGKTVLAPGKAYLVDAVYDGAHLAVYVDGNLDASASASGALDYAHVTAATGLAIGSALSTARPAFAGVLDEVAVYPAALSAAQIAAHYTAGSGVAPAPAISAYAAAVGADFPLAFYRLSDSSAIAADASPHHLSATYGTAVQRDVAGLVASDPTSDAARFPGGVSSPVLAVSAARTPTLEPAKAVSVEAWVETAGRSASTVDLVSYGPEALGQPYTLQLLPGGTVAMYVTTSTGYGFVQGRTPLALGIPHLVDATYDGSTIAVFVDGALDAGTAAGGALDYAKAPAADGVSIGTAFDTKRPAFAGVLDDVAIYGSALPANRIAAHWATGSGHAAAP